MTSVAVSVTSRSSFLTAARSMIASHGAKIPAQAQQVHVLVRTFFASSTDHTTLLSSADAHCTATSSDNSTKKYFLVPADTPQDLAERVDKLQLARLYVKEGNTIYGAKVVQRTLGTETEVCGRLLDMAIEDIKSGGAGDPLAITTLDGLCQWVEDGLNSSSDAKDIDAISAMDKDSLEAAKAIATGVPRPGHSVVGVGTYRDGEEGWKALAKEFVDEGLSAESELYKSRGGKLEEILHLGDDTREGLMSAGGAVAKFRF